MAETTIDRPLVPDLVLSNPGRKPIVEGDLAWVRLTQGMFALIDASEAEIVGEHTWCAQYATHNRLWRAGTTIGRKSLLMHQLIASHAFGERAEGCSVDHIHGRSYENVIDNRRSNLRYANSSEQRKSSDARRNGELNTPVSEHPGLTWHERWGKWQVRLVINKKQYSLGYFNDQAEGYKAYQDALTAWQEHGIEPASSKPRLAKIYDELDVKLMHELHYNKGYPYWQIGDMFGVGRQAVRDHILRYLGTYPTRSVLPVPQPMTTLSPRGKSESAKDAQIARLKERVQKLEQQVRELQQENELLYGRLASRESRLT